MKPEKIHPGIRIDAIPVKGLVGLIFTIGVLTMLYMALPHIRQFLWLVLVPGIAFGIYRIWRER